MVYARLTAKELKEKLEKYIPLMEKLHKRSTDIGRELGFIFCVKDQNIFPSTVVEGESREISEFVGCEPFDATEIGSFHTHPSPLGVPLPAAQDLCYFMERGHQFLCVSGNLPYYIGCWEILDTPERKEFEKKCEVFSQCKDLQDCWRKELEMEEEMRKNWNKILRTIIEKPIKD